MKSQKEIRKTIRDALQTSNKTPVELQPVILMNKSINHNLVKEYRICYFNDSWEKRVNALLQEGFIPFRIQTEFGLNGHVSKIYMAKMKEE